MTWRFAAAQCAIGCYGDAALPSGEIPPSGQDDMGFMEVR
jgi:hypothetical protein